MPTTSNNAAAVRVSRSRDWAMKRNSGRVKELSAKHDEGYGTQHQPSALSPTVQAGDQAQRGMGIGGTVTGRRVFGVRGVSDDIRGSSDALRTTLRQQLRQCQQRDQRQHRDHGDVLERRHREAGTATLGAGQPLSFSVCNTMAVDGPGP